MAKNRNTPKVKTEDVVKPPVEAIEAVITDVATQVLEKGENAPEAIPEALNDDNLVKVEIVSADGAAWVGKQVFTPWLDKVLLAASVGLEVDTQSIIKTESCPFKITMVGTADQVKQYEELGEVPSPRAEDCTMEQTRASFRYDFFNRIVALGKKGARIDPNVPSSRSPAFTANLLVPK